MNDLENQLAELRQQHAAIAGRIDAALIAGENSAPLRAAASTLSRDITALEEGIADIARQREAASQEAISAAAAAIVADTENARSAVLSRLAAPEHP